MPRRTKTVTAVYSEKNDAGEWNEVSKTVTTTVEHDDDGYPYGPLGRTYGPYLYDGKRGRGVADYFGWYNAIGARPAIKIDPEDGTDG